MRSARRLSIAAVLLGCGLGLLAMPVLAVPADNGAPRNLTAEWWQWAYSIPTPENPTLDPTGEKCMVGQRGSTWFLAGTYGGGAGARNCSVPAGVTLFFPVANYSFVDTPGICGQGASASVAEMRGAIAELIDGVTGITVELDGEPVQEVRRVKSRVFAVAIPEDNVYDAPCAELGGFPAGVFPRTVDDGYYATIKPLAPGAHTLYFHAENADFGFVIDTTYNLTVVAGD